MSAGPINPAPPAPAAAPPLQSLRLTLRRHAELLSLLFIAVLVLLLHARCLNDGLFMDDYAHIRQLREAEWSLRGLTDACRLELVGPILEVWWLPETTLRFFRPVAFGLMKLTYVMSDWSPVAMHAASLVWHFAACVLLRGLLLRLGISRVGALAVASLYAAHPGHIATVQWIACQTELMVTVFLLGATLAFGSARGWRGFPPAARPALWMTVAITLYMAALGSRENALLYPVVLFMGDRLLRERTAPGRTWPFVLLLIVAGGYLALRAWLLGGAALPPKPYVMPPGDPAFLMFIIDKFLYYLLGQFVGLPIVPIAGIPYFRERPLSFYVPAILILGAILFAVFRRRRSPAAVLGATWMTALVLPLLPAFASPHHLYLPSIGWAALAAVLFEAWTHGAARWQRRLVWVLSALVIGGFGAATYFGGMAFDAAQRVEDAVVDDALAAPGGIRDGDTLYFVNLPIIAHYVGYAIEERGAARDVRAVALSWSPRVLGMASASNIDRVDERTIDITSPDEPYFEGPFGLLMRDATGTDVPQQPAALADRTDVRIAAVEHDAKGVRRLRATFDHPFGTPGYRLFRGSRSAWAFEIVPGAQ